MKELADIKTSIHTVTSAVDNTTTEIQSLRKDMTVFQGQITEVETRLQKVEKRMDKERDWENEVWHLQRKTTDLEDRSRRDNVHISGVPENLESNDIMGFLPTFISKTLNIVFDPPLELHRAHRVRTRKTNNVDNPRHILICCLRHIQARQIITTAKRHGPYQLQNHQIFFSADFSAETNAKRKRFLNLRNRLKARDIRYGLLEPARMIITINDRTREFEEPEELEEFLDALETTEMETQQQGDGQQKTATTRDPRTNINGSEERRQWEQVTQSWANRTT